MKILLLILISVMAMAKSQPNISPGPKPMAVKKWPGNVCKIKNLPHKTDKQLTALKKAAKCP